MTKIRREKRVYTDDFKKQMVTLYNNGKPRAQLIREYELTASVLGNWITQFNATGSFRVEDNRTEKDKHLLELQKENKQLKMENDILKQAALIMGRK